MAKKYDIAVKTGTYQGKDGQDKGRYENCGEIHSGREGGHFAVVNPFRMMGLCMAAIARGDDRLMASLFEPRQDGQGGAQNQPRGAQQHQQAKDVYGAGHGTNGADGFDDDIPF